MNDAIGLLRAELARTGKLRLMLKAIPKSSRNEIVDILPDGSLKIKVTVAPERGKANEAICNLLAKELGVPRRCVVVVRGETSTTKQVLVTSPA